MNFKPIILAFGALLLYNCTTDTTMSPVLTTTVASEITVNSAITGGNLTTDGGSRIIEQGICWDTITNPTIAKNKVVNLTEKNVFLDTITGLKANKTYTVRAFATNSTGTSYGNNVTFTTLKTGSPAINTTAVTLITETTAASGGTITSDGGSAITARGVCWSTIPGATVTLLTKTTDGNGIGSFTSSITGLTGSTTYYVRSYATNTLGTSYGEEIFFTTTPKTVVAGVPLLITNIVTLIGYTTATSGGSITSDGGAAISARGVCWSTNASPTVALSTITSDGSGIGAFTSSITGLLPSTTYHVRAYATNSQGTGYGQDQTFTTGQTAVPTLSTSSVTLISTTTAVSGGNVSLDGGAAISSRGVCWSTSATPTISLTTKTSDGTGVGIYTSNLAGLTASTLYYVRAYATNSVGTSYGNQVTFTTSAPVTTPTVPALVTNAITAISSTTAVSGGVTTSDGGSTISARGVCWGTTSGPTTSLSTKTSDGSGAGSFTSNLTGLTASTTYYVRSYAVNSTGTGYGQELSFTTTALATIPALTSSAISSITSTTAVSGGNITTDGGSAVTARGVCWSTSSGATIALSTKTSNGTGTGSFTSNISGLTASTTYYVRAYATNAIGTAYGSELIFTTSAQASIPILTTVAISAIATTTATSGGSISADGGSAVTARGVCWSTSTGATIALSTKTSDGAGTGTFASSITGLTGSTTYYVRAYATNAVGTAYGNEVTLTTSAGSANSTGTLTVSVLTVAPGGGYQPKNVVAIWIETNAGVFVKSLLVYANARKTDLSTWYPNSSGNVVNAITGATQSSNATRTCTWNGTDVGGAVVLDGTYKVCMDIADGKTASTTVTFTKGTTAVTLTPANVTGFSNISISWVH
jgi:hypothetical protein